MAMHHDELDIPLEVVENLIGEQFPAWRDVPVRRLHGAGTVNAIYRVGGDLAARFPLRAADPSETAAVLRRETAALTELADHCPFPSPRPVALGSPGHGYPLPWSVLSWVPGTIATPDAVATSPAFARDLIALLTALRRVDTRGRVFQGGGRGGDLVDSDEWMEECLRRSAGMLPVEQLRALWTKFRSLPRSGADVMTHGDLIPGNLVLDGDRLGGVLDGGDFGPADPALDLVAVWHLLDERCRERVRTGLGCSDVEWRRGAAWAFQQSMGLVWYYRESNPVMSALGRGTLSRITTDPGIAADR